MRWLYVLMWRMCVQQSGPPMYGPYGPAAAAGPYVPYPQHFPPAPPPHHHHPGMGPVAGPHHIHHPMMHGPPVAVSGAQPPPGAGVPRHHHQCNSHGHHVHAPAGEWISSVSRRIVGLSASHYVCYWSLNYVVNVAQSQSQYDSVLYLFRFLINIFALN